MLLSFHVNQFFSLFALILCVLSCQSEYAEDQETIERGQQVFTKYCRSCHGLEEDGFGPPLGGVTQIRSRDELTKFISDAEKMIVEGDSRAIWLKDRYKQVMPPFEWMPESDIQAILAFIHDYSNQYQLPPISPDSIKSKATLSGKLVTPVKNDSLKIELEDYVHIPQLPGSSPDLGIATLRSDPSGAGSIYVSDQDGIIYRVKDGTANVFLDVRDYVQDFQSGPGIATGIASFDFHPNYSNNGLLYLYHAETFKGQKADYSITDTVHSEVQWILSEWKTDNIDKPYFVGSYRELLRLHAPTFGHGAQDLQFNHQLTKEDPAYGLLYFSYGDGGANNINRPDMTHRLNSFLGTIMRIDPLGKNSKNGNYGIPGDNPFVEEHDPSTVREIYAFGFRNPHRFSWNPENNQMIATDIGESNIEELNLIEKGGDYGWPKREGNFGINTLLDKKRVFAINENELNTYKQPFAMYDHEEGYAISGGFIYEGDIELLKNKYVFGDIVSGRLFYIDLGDEVKDASIYELNIIENQKITSLQEMSNTRRIHLRIGYDQVHKEMFIMTKCDGRIRKIKGAYL